MISRHHSPQHAGDTEPRSTIASPASSILLPAIEIEVSPTHSSRSISTTSSASSEGWPNQPRRQSLTHSQDPIIIERQQAYPRSYLPLPQSGVLSQRTDAFVGGSGSGSRLGQRPGQRQGSGSRSGPGPGSSEYHLEAGGRQKHGLRRTESNVSITLKKRGWFGQLRRSPNFILFTVFLALFVDMATYGIIVPILPFIVSDKINGGATDTGLMLGVYSIGILMASPLFGVLGDYFVSRRVPMLIGLVGMLISAALFMVATNFYVFLLARLLQGVAGGSHEASAEEAELVAMRRQERLEGSTSFWKLIKNKWLLGCVIVTACNGFAFSGAEPTVPLHLASTFNLTSERIGLVFMSFSLPPLTAPLSGALSDKFGAKVVCVVSLVLCAGSIIAGGLLQNSLPMIIFLFTIIGTTGIAILAPVLGELSAVVRTTGTGDGSARAYAMFNMAFSIGVLVGPVVCGIVYENFGFMYLSLAMASVLILAVPVAIVCLGELEQKKLDLALAKEEEDRKAMMRESLKKSKYNIEFDGVASEEPNMRWSPGEGAPPEKRTSNRGEYSEDDLRGEKGLMGESRRGESTGHILKSARMD
ncbi:MAG: major facilitator superfamily domain-containing protein [Benniella sp.]|nr:MAG: major facilitator superfamily domain-containing protein [Benniella sp.]